MRTIHILSPELIAKIAGGEVIERPAYAVKELIENSLDAGASDITILLEDAGLKKIVIHDNGQGMGEEDLNESFKLHTTSKISSEQQLYAISSLGFRGEALASIVAMADVSLQSRTQKDNVGREIKLKEGKIVHTAQVGMPVGTTVIVQNLFHATPGRKKFLKSNTTELRHIMLGIIYQAVAHPHVSFTIKHNGKKLLHLPSVKQLDERLSLLFAPSIHDTFLPITIEDAYISLRGFMSHPQFSLILSSKQHIYINNRHVTDQQMSQRIKRAYGTLLPHHRHPAFILFLKLPNELVDVNVHPRKEQVNISNKEQVLSLVEEAVREKLQTQKNELAGSALFPKGNEDLTHSIVGMTLKESVTPWLVRDAEQIVSREPIQLHKTFILNETKTGFVLIDQHAAHERILYEQLHDAFLSSRKKVKQLLFKQPMLLALSFTETQLLQENLRIMKQMGFALNIKKDNVLLSGVPELFKDRDYTQLILEFLESWKEKKQALFDIKSHQTLAYLACRQAIKAGESLQIQEMNRLLDQLDKTQNNLTCPHGRPTRIAVSLADMQKIFRRK